PFSEMKSILGPENADELDKILLNRHVHQDPNDLARAWMQEKGISVPWEIRQIKGPANRAPSQDVLPMVQDLIKNQGPWGRVDELENAGLTYIEEMTPYRGASGKVHVPEGYHTRRDLEELFEQGGMEPGEAEGFLGTLFGRRGYAQGGSVGAG